MRSRPAYRSGSPSGESATSSTASTTAPRPASSSAFVTHTPDALTPSPELAYHSGGLYEVLLALVVFAVAWLLRKRLERRPLALTWLVIALFGVGRFFEFFVRSDSANLGLGLEIAQWTSLILLAVAGVGAWLTREGRPAPRPRPPLDARPGRRRA
jgi:prolipoprotein diacylglyceryltransferase